jgi:hypothetical protein
MPELFDFDPNPDVSDEYERQQEMFIPLGPRRPQPGHNFRE